MNGELFEMKECIGQNIFALRKKIKIQNEKVKITEIKIPMNSKLHVIL